MRDRADPLISSLGEASIEIEVHAACPLVSLPTCCCCSLLRHLSLLHLSLGTDLEQGPCCGQSGCVKSTRGWTWMVAKGWEAGLGWFKKKRISTPLCLLPRLKQAS